MLSVSERARLKSILAFGDVDDIISFYETHNIEAKYDKGLDGACAIAYLFKGELKTAFEIAKNNPESVGGYYSIIQGTAIDHFIRIGLKEPSNFSKKQSLEDANEMYPELLKYESFNGQQRYNYLQMILDKLDEGTLEEKAYRYFLLAEIDILLNEKKRAFNNYLSANILNPDKALYWGYHAELMHNQDMDPFLHLYFVQQAVKLDPFNAKWRHIKVLALIKIARYFGKDNPWALTMTENQIIKETNLFYKYVRYDQIRLENAMNINYNVNFSDFVKKHINKTKSPTSNMAYVGAHMYHINRFYSKVAGVTFENRQEIVKRLSVGQQIIPVREPDNRYDSNAIALYAYIDDSVYQIGFIGKDVASRLASTMDTNDEYVIIKISEITGGGENYIGVNIQIDIYKRH